MSSPWDGLSLAPSALLGPSDLSPLLLWLLRIPRFPMPIYASWLVR